MPDQPSECDPELLAKFAASLAHDLNNMLQVVNGNLELLAERIEDDSLRGYLTNAQAGARQITELAHELWDLPHELP